MALAFSGCAVVSYVFLVAFDILHDNLGFAVLGDDLP